MKSIAVFMADLAFLPVFQLKKYMAVFDYMFHCCQR